MTPQFGDAIRTARTGAGMTMSALARLVGVTVPFMCDVEHGRRGMSDVHLATTCDVLGLDADAMQSMSGKVSPRVLEYLREHPLALRLLRLMAEKHLDEHAIGVLLAIVDRPTKPVRLRSAR